jgi:hypothetical protein
LYQTLLPDFAICENYVKSPNGLKHYHLFYPNDKRSIYSFFIETPSLQKPLFIVKLYNIIKDSEDFNINQFTEWELIKKV